MDTSEAYGAQEDGARCQIHPGAGGPGRLRPPETDLLRSLFWGRSGGGEKQNTGRVRCLSEDSLLDHHYSYCYSCDDCGEVVADEAGVLGASESGRSWLLESPS